MRLALRGRAEPGACDMESFKAVDFRNSPRFILALQIIGCVVVAVLLTATMHAVMVRVMDAMDMQ